MKGSGRLKGKFEISLFSGRRAWRFAVSPRACNGACSDALRERHGAPARRARRDRPVQDVRVSVRGMGGALRPAPQRRTAGYGAISGANIQLLHHRYPFSAHPVLKPEISANLNLGQCSGTALDRAPGMPGRHRQVTFPARRAQWRILKNKSRDSLQISSLKPRLRQMRKRQQQASARYGGTRTAPGIQIHHLRTHRA